MKVFVGLSGGVDSAVTAALLKRQGADITGVFIKGWYPEGLPCTWAEDRQDAMRVAAKLQIPFRTLDAAQEYKKSVLDYLVAEYAAGHTPNPDIMCNRDVKFGVFHDFAMREGADQIATGHYAHTENSRLYRGADPAKDQSYFLWAVPVAALRNTIFPLGKMRKDETRELAHQFSLPVAQKKDSQGICFLGPVSVEDFLIAEFGTDIGVVIDESGAEIGRHNGALLHTLGERIALESALPGPWYVLKKDVARNVLTVGRERARPASGMRISSTNWFTKAPEGAVSAQYRYHGPVVRGAFEDNRFIAEEALPEPVAAGQSLVFYRDDECLGGGIIE